MRSAFELRDADDATWSVYADELLSAGDVRGELIHLQLGARAPGLVARERELLAAHEQLGGPQRLLASLDATWRRGFLSNVRSPSVAALPVLLTHPSGALLDELTLDNPNLALDELVDAVGASGHRGLRSIVIRSDSAETRFEREVGLGHVLTLPGLRRLDASVRELSFTTRRERVSAIETMEVSARQLWPPTLATWTFPKLVRLELSVFSTTVMRGWNGYVDGDAALIALEVPERMGEGTMAPALETLTLNSWSVGELGALQLLRWLAAQPRLQLIDVSGSRVDRSARERLVSAGSRVKLPA